jgi:hypothetical protein
LTIGLSIVTHSNSSTYPKMKTKLKAERAENALLEQRLEHQIFAFNEEQEDICRDLEQELSDARELQKAACSDHDRRLRDISEAHAKQCENLCREFVEVNSQNKSLEEQIDQSSRKRLIPLRAKKETPEGKDGSRTTKTRSLASLFVLMYAIYALFTSSTSAPGRRHGCRSSLNRAYWKDTLSLDFGIQAESPFQTVLHADQETEMISMKSQAMKRFGARVNKLGVKLKRAVIKEDGESHEIPLKNAFLAFKRLGDFEESPFRGVTTKQRESDK